MARVFLSYRRSDTQDLAYRLRDHLLPSCEDVFLDVVSIPLGEDFAQVLRAAVERSDAMLALIGKAWADWGSSSVGNEEAEDYVRMEVEAAFELGVAVIPVLTHGAAMPRPKDLPESIRALARLQGLEIGSPRDFSMDAKRIIARLNEVADVYIRQQVSRHRQRVSPFGRLRVKMITSDGALITTEDNRIFQISPEQHSYVADWSPSEEYEAVLGVANETKEEIVLATETLTFDAREFDTDDADFFEKVRRLQKGEFEQ